jgi:ureidoglycolate lyase
MIVRPEPLTKHAFAPFGEVLETDGITPELINRGNTQKFTGMAEISLGVDGHTQFSIYRSHAIDLPFRIRMLERHPLGSQAFYPLHTRPFPVVVALLQAVPAAADLRVFLTNGRQGVNIHAGVWHHYQLSLEQDSDYIVIDRVGPGKNCEEYPLDQEVTLTI